MDRVGIVVILSFTLNPWILQTNRLYSNNVNTNIKYYAWGINVLLTNKGC